MKYPSVETSSHLFYNQKKTYKYATSPNSLRKPKHNSTRPFLRRLRSGSACETCRRRKTKCDGGQPCAFCSANNIACSRRLIIKNNKHKYTAPINVIELDVHDQHRSQIGNRERRDSHINRSTNLSASETIFPTNFIDKFIPDSETKHVDYQNSSYHNEFGSIKDGESSPATSFCSIDHILFPPSPAQSFKPKRLFSLPFIINPTEKNMKEIPNITDQLSFHTFTIKAAYIL